jgi:hypothetical protein
MEITKEQAKEILDVFGPCTVLYECTDATELIERAKEERTLYTLLWALIDSEDIHLEQRGNQWSGENEERFKADTAEDETFLRELKQRVTKYLADKKAVS